MLQICWTSVREIISELSQLCIPESKAKVLSLEENKNTDEPYFSRLVSICIYRDTSYIIFQMSIKNIATFKTISGFTIILGIFYFENSSTRAAGGKPVWDKVKAKYHYIKKQFFCQSVPLNTFNQSR